MIDVDFWNVGQGDASSIRRPARSWDIIDVGPVNSQLSRYFVSHPNERIHTLILTHNDEDHVGGLTALLNIQRLVIDKAYFLEDKHSFKDNRNLRRLIKKVGADNYIRLEHVSGGKDNSIDDFDGYKLIIKYPRAADNVTASNSNDTSGILSLTWNDQDVIVWGGDNKIHTIQEHVSPDMPMLFGPHHGGPSDCQLKRFSTEVGALAPRQVVLSFETKNQYGHPCPQYLSALKKSKCQLICTQRCRKCKSEKYFPLVDGDGFYRMCPPLKGTACHGHVRVIVNGLEVHDELEAEYLANKQNVRNRKCL